MKERPILSRGPMVRALQGMVVLCGYPSVMYDQTLTGWGRHSTSARISGGSGTAIREEVVWINPACQQALAGAQGGLFAEA